MRAHARCRTDRASPDRGGPPEVCQSIAKGGEELPASAVSLQPVSSFTAADQETTQSCTRQEEGDKEVDCDRAASKGLVQGTGTTT